MQESTERLELQGQTTVLTPRLDYKLFFFAWKICIKYQIYQTKNFKASFMPTNRHKGSKEITSRYVQSYVVKNSLRYRSHFTWLFHHSGGSVWRYDHIRCVVRRFFWHSCYDFIFSISCILRLSGLFLLTLSRSRFSHRQLFTFYTLE